MFNHDSVSLFLDWETLEIDSLELKIIEKNEGEEAERGKRSFAVRILSLVCANIRAKQRILCDQYTDIQTTERHY